MPHFKCFIHPVLPQILFGSKTGYKLKRNKISPETEIGTNHQTDGSGFAVNRGIFYRSLACRTKRHVADATVLQKSVHHPPYSLLEASVLQGKNYFPPPLCEVGETDIMDPASGDW